MTDRPWGLTLGALGRRGLTGQLTVVTDGKAFRVAFDEGAVIGAHSPLASDAAVRLALTSNFITSTQVPEITRRMAAAPDRDEVELLAELARIAPEHVQRMRRRLIAQRAARTFSLDRGDFVVEDAVTIPTAPDCALDIRAVVYLGAKGNISEERLGNELAMLGGFFKLKEDAMPDLPQYGFTEAEKPTLRMLVEGNNVADILAAHPEIDVRAIRAVVYALVSCGACEMGPPQPPRPRSVSAAPTDLRRGDGQPLPSGRAPAVPIQQPARPPGVPAPQQRAVPQPISGQPGSGAVRVPSGIPQPVGSQSGSGGVRVPQPMAQPGSGAVRMPSGIPQPMGSQPGSGAVRTDGSQGFSSPNTDGTGRQGLPRAGSETMPATPRARTPSVQPAFSRTKTGGAAAAIDGLARARTPTGGPPMSAPAASPPPAERPGGRAPAPRRAKRNTAATNEIESLLANKLPLLDANADYFQLLGLPQTATADEIKNTYFLLARKLHPDRLSAIGVVDEARVAQRLMAQVNAAFAVLNDPTKRAEYLSVLSRGGEAAVREEEARADEMAMRVMRAEELFKQGEMALRRDQIAQALDCFKQAVELQPNESEFQALLAWTQFAVAPDKNAVANATRKALTKAAEANDRSPTARFYLGRVERMLGKEREALSHFQEVLRIKPGHAEASSEARVLEGRLKGKK